MIFFVSILSKVQKSTKIIFSRLYKKHWSVFFVDMFFIIESWYGHSKISTKFNFIQPVKILFSTQKSLIIALNPLFVYPPYLVRYQKDRKYKQKDRADKIDDYNRPKRS